MDYNYPFIYYIDMIQTPFISSKKFLNRDFSFAKSYVNLCGLKHNFFLSFSFNQVNDYDLFPIAGLFSYAHSNLSVDSLGFGAGIGIKAGISIVIDFKNGDFGVYLHLGYFFGIQWNTFGFAYSIGVVDNYFHQGDYAGPFVDAGCAYYAGIDMCYDPRENIDNTVKAYSLTFGYNTGAYYGNDYYWYVWNFKFY